MGCSGFLSPAHPCSRSTGSGAGQAGGRGHRAEQTSVTQLGSPSQSGRPQGPPAHRPQEEREELSDSEAEGLSAHVTVGLKLKGPYNCPQVTQQSSQEESKKKLTVNSGFLMKAHKAGNTFLPVRLVEILKSNDTIRHRCGQTGSLCTGTVCATKLRTTTQKCPLASDREEPT